MRRCWVNFQCRGVLLICMIVGQGPTVLAVGAGGGCLDIFTLVYPFPPLSPSLWETARYRLKYCLKGPLNPKQPTNQPNPSFVTQMHFISFTIVMTLGYQGIFEALNKASRLQPLFLQKKYFSNLNFDFWFSTKSFFLFSQKLNSMGQE